MLQQSNRLILHLSGAMARRGQPRSQLATLIPADLHEAVREYSEETGIPIARLVEDGLRMLLMDRRGDARPGYMDKYFLGQEEKEKGKRRKGSR